MVMVMMMMVMVMPVRMRTGLMRFVGDNWWTVVSTVMNLRVS
jgi:hypothetical protein